LSNRKFGITFTFIAKKGNLVGSQSKDELECESGGKDEGNTVE